MMEQILDTVRLSDEFRRVGAKRTPEMAAIVNYVLQFAGAVRSLVESPVSIQHAGNMTLVRGARTMAQRILELAETMGFDGVRLPLKAGDEVAQMILRQIDNIYNDKDASRRKYARDDAPVEPVKRLAVEFLETPYVPNDRAADPAIDTCLNGDLRGVLHIAPPSL